MVFSTLFLIGSALSISAQNWQWFLGAGVVTKLGLGIAQTTLIVYLAEIAPFQIRGTSMAGYQLFLAGGRLLGAVATKIQDGIGSSKWRPLIASEFVITGVGLQCHTHGPSTDERRCSSSCFPWYPNHTFITFDGAMLKRPKSACFGCMERRLATMSYVALDRLLAYQYAKVPRIMNTGS